MQMRIPVKRCLDGAPGHIEKANGPFPQPGDVIYLQDGPYLVQEPFASANCLEYRGLTNDAHAEQAAGKPARGLQ